jgi:hypothetical protein
MLARAPYQASGNFGQPITTALLSAGFDVTAVSRSSSSHTFPQGVSVVRTEYTLPELTEALRGHDAVVCVVGPAGIHLQRMMVDAAEGAGVKRFVVDDFGWGRESKFEGFEDVHERRMEGWDYAAERARGNDGFTWTGISIGNPIDWVSAFEAYEEREGGEVGEELTGHRAGSKRRKGKGANSKQALKRFPLMGFDVAKREAVIYDSGMEQFTGTTLEGIGQSVVGVLKLHEETRNRTVKVMSINTCQKELLEAFEKATGEKWTVRCDSTKRLLESGQEKQQQGKAGWILELVVSQLFLEGQGRGLLAEKIDGTDSNLLDVRVESVSDVVGKVLSV